MNVHVRTLRIALAAVVVSGGLIVASCSGGSVSSTPSTQPTNAPASTEAVPTSGGTLTLLPAANGQFATLGISAGAPAGVLLTASSSTTAPGSAPAPSSLKRTVKSIGGAVPFFFLTFSVSAALPTQYIASETVTLTSADPATASYYVEFDDITQSPATKLGTLGPGVVSNGAVTFTNSGSVTSPSLEPGDTYLAQFYYIPAGTPTPSPSPTASATAGPTASPTGSNASPTPTPTPTATATGSSLPLYTFSGYIDSTGTSGCQVGTTCVSIGGNDSANGIGVNAVFANPSVTTDVTLSGATLGQISPSGFPMFTGTGTVELYIEVTGLPAATFPLTPTITVTGVPTQNPTATGCALYGYENNSGLAYAWTQIAPATGTAPVSGLTTINGVSISGGVQVNGSPFYGAIVCM